MRSNIKHSLTARVVSVILTILMLWCFGTSLLVVILNIGIGFTENTADFRNAFLNRTVSKEYGTLQKYLDLSERAKLYPNITGLQQNLQTFESRYDPENTNFRFAATDPEGQLLLTNDPDYGKDIPLLASSVTDTSISLEKRSYQINKTIEDPVNEINEIVYKDNGITQFLEEPDDYQIW